MAAVGSIVKPLAADLAYITAEDKKTVEAEISDTRYVKISARLQSMIEPTQITFLPFGLLVFGTAVIFTILSSKLFL
jgi:hypothetical protein